MPDVAANGRTVSLVVSDAGQVAGVLPSFEVETPWWQDIEPISRRHPGLAVLRLLDVSVRPGDQSGGHATYLVEPLGAPLARAVTAQVGPWTGALPDDPLRMPWAIPGGPAADLEWAYRRLSSHLSSPGTARQHRTWNLSAIWSIEATSSTWWLKCVPPFFSHEPAVLEILDSPRVPILVGAAGHRMLLEELPGSDGYAASLSEHLALVDSLVELQASTLVRIDDLLSHGVPDRRFDALLSAISRVVERRASGSKVLRRFLETAEERVREIDACGLPAVLVHGDAHPGNARIGPGTSSGIWFDWGDATIGHPLLDLGVLDRPGVRSPGVVRSHWLGAWGRTVPGSDPDRAWQLIRPFTALVGAVVYQGFLDRIEVTERVYHDADVPDCLRRAEQLLGE